MTAIEEAETFAVTRGTSSGCGFGIRVSTTSCCGSCQNEVRLLNERLLEALYLPVERRILRRLVDAAALFPHGDNENEAVITLTQESLAELAGASRSTVNQVLRAEERRGLIELQRGKTHILDLMALTQRARRR